MLSCNDNNEQPWWVEEISTDDNYDDLYSRRHNRQRDDEEDELKPRGQSARRKASSGTKAREEARRLLAKSSSGTSSRSSSRNGSSSPQPSSSLSKPISSRTSSHGSKGSNTSKHRDSSIARTASSVSSSPSSSSKRKKNATAATTITTSLTGINSTTKKSRHSNKDTNSTSGSSQASAKSEESYRKYTVKELIQSLGAIENPVADENSLELPPALERRVRDFRFAQGKRRERHGEKKPWGIWGLYEHLSDIRADLEWAEDAAWRRQHKHPYLSWGDFEKTHKGANNRPWFTYGVIAVCTIMVIVTIGVNGWKFEPLNVNPLIGPSSETLVKCGARESDLIVNEGQWFRLFTPMVLHAGLVHYVVNMLAMWFIGSAVEQSHGALATAVLFCVPAVGGNILSALCLPQYISVGASGGIFGLIGGCTADIAINWNLLFLKTTVDEDTRYRHFMVVFWLLMDILVNILIGLTPLVDNFTHLGGFLYGLFCGFSTIERLAVGFFGVHSSGKYAKQISLLMRFGGLIISVVSIMITTICLSNSDGVSSSCHGCRYVSCVPFPPGSQDKWWHCDDCDTVTADLFVAANGSGLYELVEVQCPNGDVESIPIAEHGITDREDVRAALPGYCRAHCEGVFNKHS